MKHVRKALALMLAMFVSLVIAAPAFAAPPAEDDANPYTYTGSDATTDGKITLTHAEKTKYSLYKVFDATFDAADNNKVAYTITKAQYDAIVAANEPLFVGNDAKLVATPLDSADLSKGYQVTIKSGKTFEEADIKKDTFKTFAETYGTGIVTTDNTTADANTIVWDKLPYGYYFIDTPTGANVTIDTNHPTADVIDKNTVIELDKVIVLADGTEVAINDAPLNQYMDFKVTAATENVDGGKDVVEYTLVDKMAPGFSLKQVPTVKVGSKTLTLAADPADPQQDEFVITYQAKGADVTDPAKADSFKIVIPWGEVNTTTNKVDPFFGAVDALEVTYQAMLDPAKAADVKQNAANANDAELTDKVWDPDGKTIVPGGSNPKGHTDTYDTGIKIIKKDDQGNPMKDAGFTLTKKGTDGKYGAFVAAQITVATQDKYEIDANGDHWLLKDGSYTDVDPSIQTQDTASPSYPWAVDISVYDGFDSTITDLAQQTPDTWDKYKFTPGTSGAAVLGPIQGATAQTVTVTTDAAGEATITGLATGEYMLEETTVPDGFVKADDLYFNITFDQTTKKFKLTKSTDKGATYAGAEINPDATTGIMPIDIVNYPGTEFPETGGMGTRILYTVGGLMVAGAAIYLITKKRMASEA